MVESFCFRTDAWRSGEPFFLIRNEKAWSKEPLLEVPPSRRNRHAVTKWAFQLAQKLGINGLYVVIIDIPYSITRMCNVRAKKVGNVIVAFDILIRMANQDQLT